MRITVTFGVGKSGVSAEESRVCVGGGLVRGGIKGVCRRGVSKGAVCRGVGFVFADESGACVRGV